MNKTKLLEALESGNIEWRQHALERMLKRGISRNEVKMAIKDGEIIENYKTDVPFASALFFHDLSKTIHVVASFDEGNMLIYVITAYIPDIQHFHNDLKTRRRDENE